MMQALCLLRLCFILYLVSLLRLSKLSVDQHVFESLQRSLWKAISLDLIKWWVIPHHLRPLEVKLGRSFERK
ncbi:hypothetical protein RHMOL_Rhmol01G0025100 [Rhododendron molle]|uniref:Uncharacterized protein n=1 Tax=Rhododendron molle TaxID=49168 RepID=A0ACC0PYR8_RHOML|nr:hypothetical protein RHMOL_Rhmol01G0025100 [Rhododendron molle]